MSLWPSISEIASMGNMQGTRLSAGSLNLRHGDAADATC
jgi:hypothetical protein